MIPKQIERPWVIVHCPDGTDKMETILAGPPDADHKSFGLVIADIIRHVARAYGVTEEAVIEWINKEMKNPTTKIERKLDS